MKLISRATALAGTALTTLMICFGAASAAVQSDKVLVVGVQDRNPPFAYQEDSIIKGFNVEITRAVCSQMKVSCGIKLLPRWDLVRELKTGGVDFVVDGWTRLDNTAGEFLFSYPYYRSRDIFVTADPNLKRLSPHSVSGKTVGVLGETAAERAVIDQCETKGAIISTFMNNEELFDAVSLGHVDVGYFEGFVAYDFLKRAEGLGMNPAGLLPGLSNAFTERCIAVARGRDDLLTRINKAIDEVKLSGRYQQISLTYFAFMNY